MIDDFDFGEVQVLIVDDNDFMRTIIKEILHAFHVKSLIEAKDGLTALQLLKERPVNLMITDWQMPEMDGVELVRRVRTAKGSPNLSLPIIMLTGHSELRQVVRARDAGVNEFLAKPVNPQSLYSRIIAISSRPRTFIRCDTYVGPDRRRHVHGPFEGMEDRRKNIVEENSA